MIPPETEIYYDLDLADLNREVPRYFWHEPENSKRYPKVHTYVREKRYGETVHQAIKVLNMSSSEEWLLEF